MSTSCAPDASPLHVARGCVDCGKCVALCPMAEMYADFDSAMSPRGVVRQVLGLLPETPESSIQDASGEFPALAGCVQCGSCSRTCPEAVDPALIIAHLRQTLGVSVPCCPGCGAERPTARVRAWLEESTARTPGEDDAYLALCPACRRMAYIRNNR